MRTITQFDDLRPLEQRALFEVADGGKVLREPGTGKWFVGGERARELGGALVSLAMARLITAETNDDFHVYSQVTAAGKALLAEVDAEIEGLAS